MNTSRYLVHSASFLGLGLLALGSYLPWIQVNTTGIKPLVWLPGIDSGLDLWGLIILPLAVITAVILLWRPNHQLGQYVSLLTGGVAFLLAVVDLSQYPSVDATPFAPAIGVYLTLLGGILVIVVSSLRIFRHPALRWSD